MDLQRALDITGGLSSPSKMPGHAYSLPASKCKTGSKLAKIPGTVCYGCYALKGRYNFGNVQRAMARRLAGIRHKEWVAAMVFLIDRAGDTHFRWHDSGDIQSVAHLRRICEVARLTPNVRHWLPTREAAFLQAVGAQVIPANLTIRLSATKVDGLPPASWPLTSTVGTVVGGGAAPNGTHPCPARHQGNQCGSCRACWDPAVKNVAYEYH